MAAMSYVFDFHTARSYEQWAKKPEIKRAEAFEQRLMMNMLNPMRGKFVLEVGCGSGSGLIPFIEKGLLVTGIDPSPYMLDIARHQVGHRADLHRGVGEDLPFEDNSFHYVCLNSTLEFVDDYEAVIEEACRVAKDKIYIGMMNRFAMKGYRQRIHGVLSENIRAQLQYFSVGEIKGVLRRLLGNVPIESRTICHFPVSLMRLFYRMEQSRLLQSCPFGAYAGIVAVLVPRFKTRPLTLEYRPKRTAGPVPG
jgi:ubiquinone/menaquinone biosynthesis C-methylase UbiE